MKDVIMRDVVPTISLHGIDPTAEPGKDSDSTTLSATNGASNNKNASEQTTGNGENDLYDVDDCTVIGTDPGSLREPIPPHKVVTRKRGDQEVKLDLYGAWQTEPYMVSKYVRVCDVSQPCRQLTVRKMFSSVLRYILHSSFLPFRQYCLFDMAFHFRYHIALQHKI